MFTISYINIIPSDTNSAMHAFMNTRLANKASTNKRTFKTVFGSSLNAAMVLLALMLCAQASAAEYSRENTLRRANGAEPATLDPHKAQGVTESNILRDLYEGLIIADPAGELEGGVASSWIITDGGRVYTFNLRPTTRWSNGDPVTAQDFVNGLRRSVDPATGSSYSFILYPIKNAEKIVTGKTNWLWQPYIPEQLGVTAVDDHTLKIELEAATPYFLQLLTHSSTYPIHAASVEKYGRRFVRPGNHVTNGAYQLKEWHLAEKLVLTRNPYYWDNANTRIENVMYYAVEEANTELMRFRVNDLDWGEAIPLPMLDWVKANLAESYKVHPYLGTYYYGLNTTRPPFKNNPKLRKALALTLQRDRITKYVTRGGEVPTYSFVPPGVLGYTAQQPDYADWSQKQKLELAKELYVEAGYSDNNPAAIELFYNTSEGHKAIAIAIADMWKQALGVNVTLSNQEWKTYLQTRNEKETQAFRAGWIGDYNDANTFLEMFQSASELNDVGFDDKRYDRYLKQAAAATNPVQRRQLLQLAEQRLLNAHVILPIYHYVNKRLVHKRVKGYQGNIMDHHYSKNLWLDDSVSEALDNKPSNNHSADEAP